MFSAGAYAEFGLPDTTNETDGLASDLATNGSLLSVSGDPVGTAAPMLALLNLAVG